MSVENANKEIKRFLNDPQSEVLVIKGNWGVGKTYTWQKLIEYENKNNNISRGYYSYVSLFGINSLESFKYSIFEQVIPANMIGDSPSIETLRKNTIGLSQSLGRKGISLFRNASFIKDFNPALESLAFLSVRNMIICIDDLERKSCSLSLKDVLGITTLLKEQKSCKVVLILNDEDNNIDEYKKYREKAVDIEIEFRPTPEECADIALGRSETQLNYIRLNCIKLSIVNIRLIKKIERLYQKLIPLLNGYEEEIIEQAVSSITLYSWCLYHGFDGEVPTIDYVTREYSMFDIGSDNKSEQKKKWDSIISNYGYESTDSLDLVIADSVRSGYLVEDDIYKKATEKNKEILSSKAKQSLYEAWNKFRNNFNKNQDEVVESFYKSFRESCGEISPSHVDNIVSLLRELDEYKIANELIDLYISSHQDRPEVFDLNSDPFSEEIRDTRLRNRLYEEHKKNNKQPRAREVLKRIAGKNGWGDTDERVLSETSSQEYYEIFKDESGIQLPVYIRACLNFGEFNNASERQLEIANKASEALKMIAQESKINRMRVKRFGVITDEEK